MKTRPYDLDLTAYALPLERFHYDAKEKSLSAEEFVLRSTKFDGTCPWLRPLYNDACDVGMAIRSHYSGRVVRFVLVKEETRDGDILAWHFVPERPNLTDPLTNRVKTVVIFND